MLKVASESPESPLPRLRLMPAEREWLAEALQECGERVDELNRELEQFGFAVTADLDSWEHLARIIQVDPSEMSEVDLSGLLGSDEEHDQGSDAIRNPGPFPMELISEAPTVVQRAMDHYWECAIEAQPVLFLASFIAATGAVLGHRVKDRSGLRTNIYTVGLTGTGGGKEATRETMFRIFQHAGLEAMCGQEDFASDAGLISAVVEQNPILFQIDEFGRFMHCVNSGPQRNPIPPPNRHSVNRGGNQAFE